MMKMMKMTVKNAFLIAITDLFLSFFSQLMELKDREYD
jgi:hypothetical protein